MAKAKHGDTVRVHYTGTLKDGTTFDSSRQRDALEFEIGAGVVIPGFEQAVEGMAPGETRTETLSPEQAYGPHEQEMTMKVERSRIPAGLELQVGQQFQVKGPDGTASEVTITELTETSVTLDANHPLAGKDLSFEIELVEIVTAGKVS
jgi:peptidylprolyl isomerase